MKIKESIKDWTEKKTRNRNVGGLTLIEIRTETCLKSLNRFKSFVLCFVVPICLSYKFKGEIKMSRKIGQYIDQTKDTTLLNGFSWRCFQFLRPILVWMRFISDKTHPLH